MTTNRGKVICTLGVLVIVPVALGLLRPSSRDAGVDSTSDAPSLATETIGEIDVLDPPEVVVTTPLPYVKSQTWVDVTALAVTATLPLQGTETPPAPGP